MTAARKKQEEQNIKILRELLTFEGNRYCFDCNQRGPTYINVTIGSFVCTNCGGALRKYSHRLKSISMSNFSQIEMDFIKKRGNNICKKIYYGLCENNVPPEMDIKNGMLDSHLRAKYELKKWYMEPCEEWIQETVSQNQVIFDRVERGVPKLTKSFTVNSSSNIIIEPPRTSLGKLATSKGSRTSIDLVESSNTSQHKSSDTVTNHIDPSKLGGGSAVKLPIQMGDKNSGWIHDSDEKAGHNTHQPFGDNFMFSTPVEKASVFSPIAKSQTMNFSLPPLVPLQQGSSSNGTPQKPTQNAQLNGSDKYAALAELDDLFSSSSISQGAAPPLFAPAWDSGASSNNYKHYGAMPHFVAQPSDIAANPFSSSFYAASAFNPFAPENASMQGHQTVEAANPFSSGPNSKNPFL